MNRRGFIGLLGLGFIGRWVKLPEPAIIPSPPDPISAATHRYIMNASIPDVFYKHDPLIDYLRSDEELTYEGGKLIGLPFEYV